MEVDARVITRSRVDNSMTTAIQERIRDAASAGTPLRVAGRANWLDAGRPVASADTLSLAGLTGVVDYVPSDLTITVRGGTSLADLAKITGNEGQWLPVNPFGSDDGTIGATVATGSFGPLAHGFGTIRDLVLGVEVVTGAAKTIRGGGRVVKNVAGFDMVRLMTGSWGTLGVITEVTLRLYALPSNRRTVAMEAPTEMRPLGERLRSLAEAPIIPFALELLNTEMSRRVGLPPRPMILIELGGNSPAVAAQTDALRKLGALVDASPEMWDKLRRPDKNENTVVRISGLPMRLPDRWERASRFCAGSDNAMMHASIGRGTVRCVLLADPGVEATEMMRKPDPNDTIILERAPAPVWASVSPNTIGDRVSQNIKRAFDPQAVLNPGILGPLN